MFPEPTQLTGIQCEQVSKVILKIFSSLNLVIVDMPDEIHPLILYIALTSNWHYPVQYLSLSGMEILFFNDSDEEKYFKAINGIYNDDGTKVDIESIPLPSICVICKLHMTDDWEEDLFCLMNRHDQRNENSFECGSFEKV